jgi:S-adenosylmethionine synthetase
VLAGEITSAAWVNVEAVAREAINEIGYNDPDRLFNAAGVSVLNLFSRQAADIACGVDNGNDLGADGQFVGPNAGESRQRV